MLLNPFRFASGVGWNPSDKAAGITLSAGNSMAQRASGLYVAVRATVGRSSGKYYFEVSTTTDYVSAIGAVFYAALASGSCSLTAQYIFGAPGAPYAAWRGNSQYGNDISGYIATHAGAGWAASSGVQWAGLACDLDAETVTLYDNGVVRNTLSYGTGGSPMFPLIGFEAGLSGNATNTVLRTKAADFLGSIPSGFAAWVT
jgi:hypothetical protein